MADGVIEQTEGGFVDVVFPSKYSQFTSIPYYTFIFTSVLLFC